MFEKQSPDRNFPTKRLSRYPVLLVLLLIGSIMLVLAGCGATQPTLPAQKAATNTPAIAADDDEDTTTATEDTATDQDDPATAEEDTTDQDDPATADEDTTDQDDPATAEAREEEAATAEAREEEAATAEAREEEAATAEADTETMDNTDDADTDDTDTDDTDTDVADTDVADTDVADTDVADTDDTETDDTETDDTDTDDAETDDTETDDAETDVADTDVADTDVADTDDTDTDDTETDDTETDDTDTDVAETDDAETDDTETDDAETDDAETDDAETDDAETDDTDTDDAETDDAETDDAETETVTPTMADVIETTRHFKGDEDAPVTIIEFSDFQCPYCSRFAVETVPQIAEAYIEQGIVRLGYRHAAYHEGEAYLAAEASECAANQDAFWDYHDLLVEQLAVEGKGDFPKEVLMQLATELDLDPKLFNTCLESGEYADLVREETQESASTYGISGTPAFLVNGALVVGALPYEDFAQAIETAQEGETDPALLTIELEEQEEPMTADEFMQMIIDETRHFKGDEDAPVTIIEFSDFQCPYCSRFSSETGIQIDEQYVDEGVVRFGYIHAAFHQGEAFTAAEASECAADQDAFWDYHDLLIDRMVVDGKSDFPNDVLKQYAADLELDTEAFTTCLDEGKYADLVREQTQLSSYLGVSGTPTFIINGKGLVGAQPFEVFEQVIEEEREQ